MYGLRRDFEDSPFNCSEGTILITGEVPLVVTARKCMRHSQIHLNGQGKCPAGAFVPQREPQLVRRMAYLQISFPQLILPEESVLSEPRTKEVYGIKRTSDGFRLPSSAYF